MVQLRSVGDGPPEERMKMDGIRFKQPTAPRNQLVLFAQSLDEVLGPDAPARGLWRLLEDVDWTPWERAYEGCGQPPYPPRHLAAAILYGLLHKARSSRDLEDAARHRLDFIWLLEGFTPDHSTFAEFRLRHADAIRDLQKQLARALVAKREAEVLQLLLDGTRLRADSDWHGSRTAQTLERIIGELEQRMAELARGDGEASPEEPPQDAAELEKLLGQLEQQRAKYQHALETARARDARAQRHDGKNARPVRVPITDPDAHVLPNKEGGFAPNYTPIAAVEPQTGAIVHSDVLEGSDEASAVLPAVEAAEQLTGHKANAVLADGNFAAGEILEALEDRGTAAYMPTTAASPPDNPAVRPDPSQPVAEADRGRLPKHGKHFARTAFIYDTHADIYYCPMGNTLPPYKHGGNKDGVPCTYYRAHACPGCPLARDCVKGKDPCRTLVRDRYEPLREATAQRMATPEGRAIYKARAPGIEGVFAQIKAILGIRRFTLRGLEKVRLEWSWICAAYNLKKLLALEAQSAKKTGPNTTQRPFFSPPGLLTRSTAAHGIFLVQKNQHPILPAIRPIGRSPCTKTKIAV